MIEALGITVDKHPISDRTLESFKQTGQVKKLICSITCPVFVSLSLFNFSQLYLHSGEFFLNFRKAKRVILSILLV